MGGAGIPIYKVGVVLFEGSGPEARTLIIRPHPKNTGETPVLVLPRGSRQYQDAEGWHDVRDEASAIAHAAHLEPLTRTLIREAEEEAGLPSDWWDKLHARADVWELGPRVFASRTKPPYPIYWFVVQLEAQEIPLLRPPADASETHWANLAQLHALAQTGEFSPGYVPVVEEALQLL